MPPKGATKAGRGGAAAAKKATPAKSPKGRGKKRDEEDEEAEDDDDEEFVPQGAKGKKKTPAKKAPASEDEEEEGEEELDEDEEGLDDEEEGDEDDEDEDYEEEEEEEEEGGKPRKTLFIKNLASTTTEDEVKALSPDILSVKLEAAKKPGDKIYAVVEFADEEIANRNLESLKSKKVGGNDIIVDFIGSHSIVTFVTPALTPSSDPLKLYVTGFGRDITIDQLKTMFPTSSDVTLPLNPKDNNRPIGYAFIHYTDEAVARKAHDMSQDLTYQNRTLVVMYGKKTPPPGTAPAPTAEQKRKSPAGAKRGPKSKKAKKESEEEEEEEEEEEDGDGDD